MEKLRKGAGVALLVRRRLRRDDLGDWRCRRRSLKRARTLELAWVRGESAGVAAANAAHKPAFLDFYADWCLPCKELDLKVFHQPEVVAELQRFQLVKVDCTHDDDPVVASTQERYGAATLPTLVFLGADGKVAKKIDHFVEKDEFLAALRAVH